MKNYKFIIIFLFSFVFKSVNSLGFYPIFNAYIYQSAENSLIENENKYIQENIKITQDTIFAFDINRVLIKPDFKKIWQLTKNKLLKKDLFKFLLRPYIYYLVLNALVNELTPEEIVLKIQKNYPNLTDFSYNFIELTNAQKPNKMSDLIEKLHNSNYKLILLTNLSNDKINGKKSSFEILKENFKIFDYFDLNISLFSSYEDNYLKKPNPKFYKKFLNNFINKIGADKIKNIVFIDDKIENIIAARKEGISSILFISSQDLIEKLIDAGLKI